MTTINFANDLGYGSIKATLNGKKELVPSVIAYQRSQNMEKPITFDTEEEKKAYIDNFFEHMDCSISSASVKTTGRFYIGKRAIDSGLPTVSLDINDLSGKSQNDLSVIFTLSLIGAKRIQEAYNNNEDLTKPLLCDVNMTTALPINEGKENDRIEEYEKRFMNQTHTVTFQNFKDPITVQITFKKMYTALEGEPAQLAISQGYPKGLKKGIEFYFRKNYKDMNDVSIEEVISTKNTIGVDIGEGTTDIVSISNGRSNPNASRSIDYGYGKVLEDALDVLQAKHASFNTRSELQNFLDVPATGLNRRRKQQAEQIVFDQLQPFVQQIVTGISQTMRSVGNNVDVIYVYGGGSIPLSTQTNLDELLQQKVRDFSGGIDIPIIWIDKNYARILNEIGLELILSSLTK